MWSLLSTWQFWAFASAFFAALTAIFAKVGVEVINSNYATFIRTVVILIFVTIILFVRREMQPLSTISTKSILFLILSGVATGMSWLCYFRALQIGDVAKVAPLDKISVILVAIFSVAFLHEKLSTYNWIGIALITIGIILVIL